MAGIFSQQTIERIRAASDIVDVIGSYVPLKRAGANFVALCPFHKEKSPSFNVNPHRQIFHCFGCHKGGDVFTFVKEYENVGFSDAVHRLAERAKIPIEFEKGGPDAQVRHIKDQLLQIHEQITQRWQTALVDDAAGQIARDYLAKRGVSAEAVKLFRIGYAPDLWDDTVNWARSKNYEMPVIEKAGLILKKEGSDHYYDRFRGRLMFPICDEQGRVIAFSGRVLSGDEKTAKYVNSPETPIFTKSKVFFGLDKSKRAILDAELAVICEGQLDTIACFMAGIENVVAPQGTAFTMDHARIMKRFAKKVVLCFDSDNAGQNATSRSLDTLLAAGPELFSQVRDKNSTYIGRLTQRVIHDWVPSGLSISVAIIPSPHDPDSFIKAQGVEAFRKLIREAPEFFDFLLNRLCKTHGETTDVGRRQILDEMNEALKKTGSPVLVDKYAQKTALRLGVTPDAVRAEFKKSAAQRKPETESEAETIEAEESPARPSTHEFWLLKIIFADERLAAWTALHLNLEWIQHSVVRRIIQLRLAAQSEEKWQNLAAFLDTLDLPEARSLVTEATTDDRPIPNPEQQIADVALRLRNQFLDRQLAALALRASQPETSESEKLELLHQQQELRNLKRQPLTALGGGG